MDQMDGTTVQIMSSTSSVETYLLNKQGRMCMGGD